MSAATHAQDPAINERRLKPIYDHLDVGNNKKALQEADKVVKKYPSIQCARALKSLVLLRLGREQEASGVLQKLADEQPTDEQTLQAMTFCYKDMEELDKICELYGNAVRQMPSSEDMLSHLFMAHVRVNNYQAQQTVALQLYKVNPKNPYYFWAVMSIVLKARYGAESSDPAKSSMLLALAQRMIDKNIADNKLDAEQEAQLYLNVLRLQGKHAEALAFLESDKGRQLYPGAPVSMRIDAMRQLGRWSDLERLVRGLLKDNRERWDYYKEFVECAVQLNKGADGSLAAADAAALRPYNEFIGQLIEADAIRIRGPFLGRLLLHKTLKQHGYADADALIGATMLELLVEYFQLFGQKPCCTNDIQMFLECLSTDDRVGLAERLLSACKVSATALPQNKDQMQQHICTLQISRICGAHELGVDHLYAMYTAFSLHYEHGMTAFGMNLLPTDMGPSDAYALLAAHVMYDLSLQLASSAPLVEALCLLNYVLSNSPSNFHAKLLCLQIYHRLGCGWGAHKTYETLDVKHVQLDSMGYLHCVQLPAAGIPTVAKPLYDQTLKFFTASYKESLEYLSTCYRFGSFSKLQEFMEFRDRLSNSLHYALVSAEALMGEMVGMSAARAEQIVATVGAFNLEPRRDRLNYTEMTDNRDLSVVVRWDAKSVATDGEVSSTGLSGKEAEAESFRQDVQLLRLRSLMLRIIGACVNVYDAGADRTDAVETVVELRARWAVLMAEVRAMNMRPVSAGRLTNLLPSRLHGVLRQPYEAFFEALTRVVLALDGGEEVTLLELNAAEDALRAALQSVEQRARDSIVEHGRSEDLLWERRFVQEVVVNCLEILAIASLVLSIAADKYKTLSIVKVGRKNKQKADQQNGSSAAGITDRDRLGACQSLVGILQSILSGLDDVIRDWAPPLCPDDLIERIAAMSLNPNVEPVVQTTLRDGHLIAVQEMRAVIKEKLRMLRSRD